MIDPKQFRELVVRPTLQRIGLHSDAAENLLVGTAIQESGLRHLKQMGNGPALGVYQVEPATHTDIWENFLKYRANLWGSMIGEFRPAGQRGVKHEQLVTDLAYATAIARLVYFRRPEPLPDADDIEGLGGYYKSHFNTHLGKGTAAQFVLNYREHN